MKLQLQRLGQWRCLGSRCEDRHRSVTGETGAAGRAVVRCVRVRIRILGFLTRRPGWQSQQTVLVAMRQRHSELVGGAQVLLHGNPNYQQQKQKPGRINYTFLTKNKWLPRNNEAERNPDIL